MNRVVWVVGYKTRQTAVNGHCVILQRVICIGQTWWSPTFTGNYQPMNKITILWKKAFFNCRSIKKNLFKKIYAPDMEVKCFHVILNIFCWDYCVLAVTIQQIGNRYHSTFIFKIIYEFNFKLTRASKQCVCPVCPITGYKRILSVFNKSWHAYVNC